MSTVGVLLGPTYNKLLGKCLPSTAEMCKPKEGSHHQNVNEHGTAHTNAYRKEPQLLSKNVTMTFYNEKEKIYTETDAPDIDIGASLL